MKAKGNQSGMSSANRISNQWVALLKRRIITAALTLGYWTLVLVWSVFK